MQISRTPNSGEPILLSPWRLTRHAAQGRHFVSLVGFEGMVIGRADWMSLRIDWARTGAGAARHV